MPFNQYKWRTILPIGQLIAAVILQVIGQHEYHVLPSQQSLTSVGGEWIPEQAGVLAPATQLAYAINFPALLIVKLIQVFARDSAFASVLFLCCVFAIWYVVGHICDTGAWFPKGQSILVLVSALVGTLGSIIGIWFTWHALGTHYWIPPIGAVCWLVVFGAYCIKLARSSMS